MTSLDRVRCDHCGREEDALRATRWLFLGTRSGQLAGDICERCTVELLPELGERLELLLGRPDDAEVPA